MKTADTLTKPAATGQEIPLMEVGDASGTGQTACATGQQPGQPGSLPSGDTRTAASPKTVEQRRKFMRQESPDVALAGFAFGGSMTESPVSRAARKKISRPWETWE
jgi:hypothetical protein